MPKGIFMLEKLFDLENYFCPRPDTKTQISLMLHDKINIRT